MDERSHVKTRSMSKTDTPRRVKTSLEKYLQKTKISKKMASSSDRGSQSESTQSESSHTQASDTLTSMVDAKCLKLESIFKEALQNFKDTILNDLENIKKDVDRIDNKYTDLEEKVNGVIQSLEFTQSNIETLNTRTDTLETENELLKEEITKLNAEKRETEQELSKAKTKLMDMERYSREYNLRLLGVPEQRGESCKQVVAKTICDHKLAGDADMDNVLDSIENAHRTGNRKTGVNRHIIVKFYSRPVRNSLLRTQREINNQRSRDNTFFVEDLIKEDYLLKKKALKQMQQAHTNKQKVRFYRGRLIINGQLTPIHDDTAASVAQT